MTKLLSLIPMLFSIFRRASALRGITQSKTSQVQAGVLFAVCLLVAALGHFVPDLANNETATVIVSLIISISLAATQAHLEDMRSIAMDLIKSKLVVDGGK